MKIFHFLIVIGTYVLQVNCCGEDIDTSNSSLNLMRLWEDATHKCIEEKGVGIPEYYCNLHDGEILVGESKNENYVCCLLNVTEKMMESVSPIVKNNDRILQHSDFIELRSKCVKSNGLVSHYCKAKSKNCDKPHASIGYDYFEWTIIGKGMSKGSNIRSGDTIALEANDHYLKCSRKKCYIKKLFKKCRFNQNKGKYWTKRTCIQATYKIYSDARQGNCTFDNDLDCKGDMIRQGDEVFLSSLSTKGKNYKLSNHPENGPLSDVVLMNDKSKGYDEQCSTMTIQIVPESLVDAFPNPY